MNDLSLILKFILAIIVFTSVYVKKIYINKKRLHGAIQARKREIEELRSKKGKAFNDPGELMEKGQ